MFQAPCPDTWSLCRVYGQTAQELSDNLQTILDNPKTDIPSTQKNYPYRFIQHYQDINDLHHKIQKTLTLQEPHKPQVNHKMKTCLLFTGQGSQWAHMGAELSQTIPFIKKDLEDSIDYLHTTHGINLYSLLSSAETQTIDINQTLFTQPSIVVIELAIASYLLKIGMQPDYVIGHSVGEIAASHFAGFYKKEAVLDLIAHRAKLMQAMPPIGSMLACKADQTTLEKHILNHQPFHDTIQLAGLNSPKQTVLSGKTSSIQKAEALLKEKKIRAIPLSVSHAFHSKLMTPMIPAFKDICDKIKVSPPLSNPQLILNVNAQIAQKNAIHSDYWCQHILQPVNFLGSMRKSLEHHCQIYVEVGPQPVLTKLVQQNIDPTHPVQTIACLSKKNPVETFLSALANLEKIL